MPDCASLDCSYCSMGVRRHPTKVIYCKMCPRQSLATLTVVYGCHWLILKGLESCLKLRDCPLNPSWKQNIVIWIIFLLHSQEIHSYVYLRALPQLLWNTFHFSDSRYWYTCIHMFFLRDGDGWFGWWVVMMSYCEDVCWWLYYDAGWSWDICVVLDDHRWLWWGGGWEEGPDYARMTWRGKLTWRIHRPFLPNWGQHIPSLCWKFLHRVHNFIIMFICTLLPPTAT